MFFFGCSSFEINSSRGPIPQLALVAHTQLTGFQGPSWHLLLLWWPTLSLLDSRALAGTSSSSGGSHSAYWIPGPQLAPPPPLLAQTQLTGFQGPS
jgi:hypothetical protein